eukprot:2669859-Pyramimonas_sp.AAC.1
MAWLGLSEGLLRALDSWGAPAMQALVARCPATEVPPCPACPACPPCPGATVGATAGAVTLACLAAGVAGASIGALRVWGRCASRRRLGARCRLPGRCWRRRRAGRMRAWLWQRLALAEALAW